MARPVDEWLLSFEFMLRPPFLRRMRSQRQDLSERLELVTFIGHSGSPKRYMISKTRGRSDRMAHGDISPFIWFWRPETSFRKTLNPGGPKQRLGPGVWLWDSDLSTMYVLDDMSFHIRRDEALALKKALFDDELA